MFLITLLKFLFNIDYFYNLSVKTINIALFSQKLLKECNKAVVPVWSKSRYYLQESLRDSFMLKENCY